MSDAVSARLAERHLAALSRRHARAMLRAWREACPPRRSLSSALLAALPVDEAIDAFDAFADGVASPRSAASKELLGAHEHASTHEPASAHEHALPLLFESSSAMSGAAAVVAQAAAAAASKNSPLADQVKSSSAPVRSRLLA